MKNLIMVIALILTGSSFGQGALGEVTGTVIDKGTGKIVYGAVAFIDDFGTKYQARTDADGRFRISAIPAGKYTLNIKYFDDTLQGIQVNVPMDGIDRVGEIKFSSETLTFDSADAYSNTGIKLVKGAIPFIEITSKDLVSSPDKNNIKDLIVSKSSDVKMSNDGQLVFRGARKGDMLYMMDGVKTSSIGAVPSSSIGRMMIYAGGLPAKYGDTLGGVVVMESKSYFDLYRAWVGKQVKLGLY